LDSVIAGLDRLLAQTSSLSTLENDTKYPRDGARVKKEMYALAALYPRDNPLHRAIEEAADKVYDSIDAFYDHAKTRGGRSDHYHAEGRNYLGQNLRSNLRNASVRITKLPRASAERLEIRRQAMVTSRIEPKSDSA
jgi:hypothetical protein